MSEKYAKDSLGSRMKDNYEMRFRHSFPRRTYLLIRVDGRSFHTWTRGLARPYDVDLMSCMDAAASRLCKEIAGAQFAFVQSDEISILVTDFTDIGTQAWFDNCQNKIESISASIATMAFNLQVSELRESALRHDVEIVGKLTPISKKTPNAMFDSRAWIIPDPIEVENYFIDRQKDAERNSVTMLASAYASHKELQGKSVSDRHEIIHKAGDNWAHHPVRFKHGGIIRRMVTLDLLKAKQEVLDKFSEVRNNKEGARLLASDPSARTKWELDENTPVFTKNREYLRNMIPRHWENDESIKKD